MTAPSRGEDYNCTARPQAVVAPALFVAAPSLTIAATPESTAALDQGAAASDAKAQEKHRETEARGAVAIRTAEGTRTASSTRALQIALAVAFVVLTTVGWDGAGTRVSV